MGEGGANVFLAESLAVLVIVHLQDKGERTYFPTKVWADSGAIYQVNRNAQQQILGRSSQRRVGLVQLVTQAVEELYCTPLAFPALFPISRRQKKEADVIMAQRLEACVNVRLHSFGQLCISA